MSHFAYVNPYTHLVEKVIVIEEDMIETGEFGDPKNFIQCSYNGEFRGCYPGVGYHYLDRSINSDITLKDCFIPPCPTPGYFFHEKTWNWHPDPPSEKKFSSLLGKFKKKMLDISSKS